MISYIANQGVHHAKYMLVFVETGVYVAISSGNVSAQLSLDATWTQYFRRTERSVAQTNDFGEVLEDFLSHQADQILVRHCDSAPREVPNLMSWLRLNLKLGKGRSLASMFDWNAASVDLVTTVPGSDRQFMSQDELKEIYEKSSRARNTISGQCERCCKRIRKDRVPLRLWTASTSVQRRLSFSSSHAALEFASFSGNVCYDAELFVLENDLCYSSSPLVRVKYGAERLRDILAQRQSSLPRVLTMDDIVIVQPTAISNGIDIRYMSYLLSCMLTGTHWSIDWFESWKLLWPTHDFVTELKKHCKSAGCGLFLFSNSLKQMKEDVHDQFYTYDPSVAPIFCGITEEKAPHIKSYSRVMSTSKSTSSITSSSVSGSMCSCTNLAWFLLTSACLSKGANGEEMSASICEICGHLNHGCHLYKNFEIGVLFHSSRQRQYRALSSSCRFHSTDCSLKTKGRIDCNTYVLPVPYDICSETKYCSDLEFQIKPFMKSTNEVLYFSISGSDIICKRSNFLSVASYVNQIRASVIDKNEEIISTLKRTSVHVNTEELISTENKRSRSLYEALNNCSYHSLRVVVGREEGENVEVDEEDINSQDTLLDDGIYRCGADSQDSQVTVI